MLAKLSIDGKDYLLDAVDDFLPFGVISERCLNGRGRVLEDKKSYWYDIVPSVRLKKYSLLNLTLQKDGLFEGTIELTYNGYHGVRERINIFNQGSLDAYTQSLRNRFAEFELENIDVKNLEDMAQPLRVLFSIKSKSATSNFIMFNPLFIKEWKKNPFISNERSYPVDFGAPVDEVITVNLNYPEDFEIKDVPSRMGGLLPNQGGRFIAEFSNQPQRLTVNSSLQVLKTVYSPHEYHYLRALFDYVVSASNAQIVFERKE